MLQGADGMMGVAGVPQADRRLLRRGVGQSVAVATPGQKAPKQDKGGVRQARSGGPASGCSFQGDGWFAPARRRELEQAGVGRAGQPFAIRTFGQHVRLDTGPQRGDRRPRDRVADLDLGLIRPADHV